MNRPIMTLSNSGPPSQGILLNGCVDTAGLLLHWSEAPWDTAVFGFPVLQIDKIKICGDTAGVDMQVFEKARDAAGCKLVSCRLNCDNLRESIFLEGRGFRFIEMVYQPVLERLQNLDYHYTHGLSVVPAVAEDMPDIIAIAGTAFHNERFHVDPRLPPHVGDLRYQNWVRSTFNHESQRTYVLRDNGMLVAFFVIENLQDGTCFWHLNAVSPALQGKGYGLRAWHAMIEYAKQNGALAVRSSIVARNHRVLNLYARLGFRFPIPSMTFHWVQSA